MGCCLSRDGSLSVSKEEPLPVKQSPDKDVETVKEILQQTPTPAAKHAAETELPELDQTASVKLSEVGPVSEDEASPERREAPGMEKVVYDEKSFKLPVTDEVSDLSEAYESRSTTTVTEIRDDVDDNEVVTSRVRQRINRSPARFSNRGSTQRLPTATPTSISRTTSNRPLQTRNGVVSNSKPRQESNQSPVRKPADTRRAVGESPVRRTVSPSSRRVNGLRPINHGQSGPNRVERVRMEESLENPLVSLECFIFL